MDYCVGIDPEEAEEKIRLGSLSHAEMADTLLFLRTEGHKPAQLQKVSGLKDYTVRHYLRMAKKLESSVKDLLHRGIITFSMARVIASLSPEKQDEEVRSVIMKGTSVAKFRNTLGGNDKFCDIETERYFQHLQGEISKQTGLALVITPDRHDRNAGNISLRYTDLRDFDAICSRLSVNLSEI